MTRNIISAIRTTLPALFLILSSGLLFEITLSLLNLLLCLLPTQWVSAPADTSTLERLLSRVMVADHPSASNACQGLGSTTIWLSRLIAWGGVFCIWVCSLHIAKKRYIGRFAWQHIASMQEAPIQTLVLPVSYISETQLMESGDTSTEFNKDGREYIIGHFEQKALLIESSENNCRAENLKEICHPDFKAGKEGNKPCFANFSWQQQFRVLYKVLMDEDVRIIKSPNSIRLKRIYLQATKSDEVTQGSESQQEHMAIMLKQLVRMTGRSATTEFDTEEDDASEQPDNIKISCLKAINDGNPQGFLHDTLRSLLKEIGLYKNKPTLLIDITGGQKTYSAAATLFALREEVCFVYVRKIKQSPYYKVEFHDVRPDLGLDQN